jgi:hypothetical protein
MAQFPRGAVMTATSEAFCADETIYPGKSAPVGGADFTKEMREVPVKPKLKRVPFTVSRLMEFCTKRELVNQTGHDFTEWPLVVLKELIDNSVDACEEAGIAPIITVQVDGDRIAITDNGPGIPASVIDGVLDYSIRVSSREAYVSPTRGAQGNALKTIMPMGYVLDERGEEASSVTLIEAHGVLHRVKFAVDHIRQEPKISRIERASRVTVGTKVTVMLPIGAGYYGHDNLFEFNKTKLLEGHPTARWDKAVQKVANGGKDDDDGGNDEPPPSPPPDPPLPKDILGVWLNEKGKGLDDDEWMRTMLSGMTVEPSDE